MTTIQFEAGTQPNGTAINYLFCDADNFRIYAEVEVPENASEDYGYITMRKAVEEQLPGYIRKQIRFCYDGQEQYLAEDAEVQIDPYISIEIGEDSEGD